MNTLTESRRRGKAKVLASVSHISAGTWHTDGVGGPAYANVELYGNRTYHLSIDENTIGHVINKLIEVKSVMDRRKANLQAKSACEQHATGGVS